MFGYDEANPLEIPIDNKFFSFSPLIFSIFINIIFFYSSKFVFLKFKFFIYRQFFEKR